MRTMLSYADTKGRRFYATSQSAMNRHAANDASIDTLAYSGSQQVRMDLLQRVGRGVYVSKNSRIPFVLSVRQAGRPSQENGGEEFVDFAATISDGRVISVRTGSCSAPSYSPDVNDDLAAEIFAELPE